MKILNSKLLRYYIILIIVAVFSTSIFAQTPQDSTQVTVDLGSFPNSSSIESKYTYDPVTDTYIYTQDIENLTINQPIILTPEEYQKLIFKEQIGLYYKEKIDIIEGVKDGAKDQQKDLIPELYIKKDWFKTIFGSDVIEVIPQGSVEVDLGGRFTKQDNPLLSPQNRSNFTFDFDQRISVSLLGKVGTRLQVAMNYDTQSTFDFQNRIIKLEFTSDEDDIVRKIEVGNVNMPLNSSLITGAQSLFGVKTELQFGRTTIAAVFSKQNSETRSVVAQGGGTVEEFSFLARDYDENRHFFLSHYFRDYYDEALLRYPFINSKVQITRVEVWITNRNNQTDNVRNVLAFQDLGESDVIGLPTPPAGFVNVGPGAFPDNGNNDFDPENIGGAGSALTEAVRDITTVEAGILVPNPQEGFDFGKLENAKKLREGVEYTVNTQLGYISLNQRLSNDEILAVAFQYTSGGEVYQVGEFANDGLESIETNIDIGTGNQIVNNNNLILKMLKSTITDVNQPIWDLMMKNIYDTGAYQISQEDFRLNIFYTEASPLNYITPVSGTTFPTFDGNTTSNVDDTAIEETPLIRLFHLDQLNFNNDPQRFGDGFFDFVEDITVVTERGRIIFTKVEPFGRYLFDVLDDDNNALNNATDYEADTYSNLNQEKYVYDLLYKSTKTAALEESEKNKFQIKGRYKSTGNDGIALGAFNVPRGSVKVTAGGRVLIEGQDYTVNYQIGRVYIINEALETSNVPIDVSVENNSIFSQRNRRFLGLNVEHKFDENFVIGGTFLNLRERPFTQKATYNSEPINNTILGLNTNYSTEVPFFTRLANKLPNIDTDAVSNLSVRGEFAYLFPGAPRGTDFDGEATAYIDDFEGSQFGIDLLAPYSWSLSSRPLELGRVYAQGAEDDSGIQNGFDRAWLNWYSIDPIFYGNQQPGGINDDDISDLNTRRVFIEEIFPEVDLVQGQLTIVNTLDLAYYPRERGPYNFDPDAGNDSVLDPLDSWAGIMRQISSTDFEQTNVEYIEFWVQDPFLDNTANPGGVITFNLGNISEDVIKDGKKMYENGLPENGDISTLLPATSWGSVVPNTQSLVYTFSTQGQERTNQDVGLDGYDDEEEINVFGSAFGPDPSKDNYNYFLNVEGDILTRYKQYNGLQGNTPDSFSNTNRGSTTEPDVEDINRDNTMNTIDSYYEYEVDITPTSLADPTNPLINDIKTRTVSLPNGSTRDVKWYQFRVPVSEPTKIIGGISDIRSVRYVRLYLKEFSESTVLRFATLELVRSDWRRYSLSLDDEIDNSGDNTNFNVGIVGVQENDGSYISPPGTQREAINNNNNVVRQNEQALIVETCNLEPQDSRAVFKNITIDMRQYKKLRMFIHAEPGETPGLEDGDLVAFIRMGNDFTENYYQIEIPLSVSNSSATAEEVWPDINEINLQLSVLEQIKSIGISPGAPPSNTPTYYDVTPSGIVPTTETAPYILGQQRVAIRGNPNFGDLRALMLGVKNSGASGGNTCGNVWFNELRISDLDNEGGWASVLGVDTNLADVVKISATGRMNTIGFGGIEQGPNERSREEVKQYDVVTNVELGQLLPKKWGLQIPFNYGQGEEIITPEYDQFYRDIKLKQQLNTNTQKKDSILNVNETYTKRQSINFIGVKKTRSEEAKPHFYDVENLTLNFSHNKVEFRDFEIEESVDYNINTGANYNYNFAPLNIEPFKKNDSLFRGKYWQLFKDFNLNLMPTEVTATSNISRQFNKQKFRSLELGGSNIGIQDLYKRNYTFDFQYGVNYNLTKSLNFNFTASRNNIVRNYFVNDSINGVQDPSLNVWDGFFDTGDPNTQVQQLQVNYQLPFDKLPFLNFLNATYSYTGDFAWQKGSDLNENLSIVGDDNITRTYNLGHSIQNAATHNINTSLDMKELYKYIGLKRKYVRKRTTTGSKKATSKQKNTNKKKTNKKTSKKGAVKFKNTAIDILTAVKRVQLNYTENRGTYLPGYLRSPGFFGTLKPTFGYTFGGQNDIRHEVARRGWLTVYPDFNEQYTETMNRDFNFSADVNFVKSLKITLTGGRNYSSNTTENFNTSDIDNNGLSDSYNSLITNTFGNFNISTALISTAFSKSDEFSSSAFEDFKSNRLVIANRLAKNLYGTTPYALDAEGYPEGFGKNSQSVLLPAFLAAYTGKNANKISLRAFRDIPIPNWNIKYTGLMNTKWFKKNFKRVSLTSGYQSSYTLNQFRTNLDYVAPINGVPFASQSINTLNQSNNYKSNTLFSNINLEEQFSPLFRLDLELKNSVRILTEMKKDRMLSLSLDNNLLTEIQGNEYILGLGYRFKDVKIRSKYATTGQFFTSDLNMKLDASVRNNKTIIRYLDLDNNQVTAGQTIWGIKYTADYAFTKQFTTIFYFDYTFSEYAISTSFPQTTIRGGFTIRYNFGN